MRRTTAILLGLLGLLCALSLMAAQRLYVDVNLTMLRAYVVDERGDAVLDLAADDFKLLENGRPVPISHFSLSAGTAEIGFLADTSLGAAPVKEDLKQTVGQFVRMMNGDRAFLMTFAGDTERVVPPTYDLAAITKALANMKSSAGTRFNDAVLRALDQLAVSKRERKALIILTTGADHRSAHAFEQVLRTAKLYGYEIYIIGYPGDESRTWSKSMPSEIRSEFFQLASVSGGQVFFPANALESSRIARKVLNSLHHEYRFGFYSSHAFDEPSEVSVQIRGERGKHLYVRSSLIEAPLP
jgi:VWFA-related protein